MPLVEEKEVLNKAEQKGKEEYKVIFYEMKDVSDFVTATSQIPFPMDLGYGKVLVDAKSIQGVAAMGLGKKVNLKVHGILTNEMKALLKNYVQ